MLKIIAAMVASCAVLAGLALAIEEDAWAGLPLPTDTPTPAPTDTPSPAPSVTASPTVAPTSTAAGTASPTTTASVATVTPAAVPGTGGDPGGSSNLLLILAIGAGVVAGTAGLAGFAVTRRS
jgi:hypothetical protein